MLTPIIACENPFKAAKLYEAAGWSVDFSKLPESGDPLVGVSLCANRVLLGVKEGYVRKENVPRIACGVQFYVTIPQEKLEKARRKHRTFSRADCSHALGRAGV